MIPIRLEVNAFGPFASKQTIDFTAFENDRIFLITGNTGSGKTTIFDAICFSLYGTSSGELRDTDSFKSQFANDSEVCYAEFEFLNNGKRYVVNRTPIQDRLKKNGELTRANATALITLENGDTISGATAVNSFIEELLGLNPSQFKKIVMLPQGEFRRFLLDDGDEKQKTLRSIFSTAELDNFTQKLRDNALFLRNKAQDDIIKCDAISEGVRVENGSELYEKISAKNKDYLTILKLIKEDLSVTKKESDKKAKVLLKLEAEKSVITLTLSIADREASTKNAIKEYKKSKNEFAAQMKKADLRYENALKEQNSLTDYAVRVEKLDNELGEIVALKEKFRAKEQLEIELSLSKQQFEILQKNKENIEINEKQGLFMQQKNKLMSALSFLEDCRNVEAKFLQASDEYKSYMNGFISSQAYLLANEQLKDDSPCPVCGSLTHPHPAEKSDFVVTKNELEGIKLVYDKLTSTLTQAKTNYNHFLNELKDEVKFSDKAHTYDENTVAINIAIATINANLGELKSKINESFTTDLSLDQIIEKQNITTTNIAVLTEKVLETKKQLKSLTFDDAREKAISSEVYSLTEMCKKIKNEFQLAINEKAEIASKRDKCNEAITQQESIIEKIRLEKLSLNASDAMNSKEQLDELCKKIETLSPVLTALAVKINTNETVFNRLKTAFESYEAIAEEYKIANHLYDVANGTFSNKVNFERYILAGYFEKVLRCANLRLEQMTNSRYTLKRRTEKEKGLKASGLTVEVFDSHTGRARHVKTMSGGEIFKISLCLALGLADVMSQNAGGIELSTMFIDEGFGTLDSASLDTAIDCLEELKTTGRYIGIISHVSEIANRVTQKIMVISQPNGSYVKYDG